jgi:hypothetical protein
MPGVLRQLVCEGGAISPVPPFTASAHGLNMGIQYPVGKDPLLARGAKLLACTKRGHKGKDFSRRKKHNYLIYSG